MILQYRKCTTTCTAARKGDILERPSTNSRPHRSRIAFLAQRAVRWYRLNLSISSLSVDFVAQQPAVGLAAFSIADYCTVVIATLGQRPTIVTDQQAASRYKPGWINLAVVAVPPAIVHKASTHLSRGHSRSLRIATRDRLVASVHLCLF